MMRFLVGLAASLVGCATPTTPLAELQDPLLSLATSPTQDVQSVGMHPMVSFAILATGCPTLDDGVIATFDGQPMSLVSAGGEETSFYDGTTCTAIQFDLVGAANKPRGTVSTLRIVDGRGTTWTVEGQDLMTDDLALVTPPVTGQDAVVSWTIADDIESADADLWLGGHDVSWSNGVLADPALAINGNTVRIPIPSMVSGMGIFSIEVDWNPVATRCEGPAGCSLEMTASKNFPVSLTSATPPP
jgi:hypothetical protein